MKKFYYVLVLTKDWSKSNCYKANYVTDFDYTSKMCYWRENEKPKHLPKCIANDIADGLTANGYNVLVVVENYEL